MIFLPNSPLPDTQVNQLFRGHFGPTPVGCWAGWAGMEDPCDFDSWRRDAYGAFFSKRADADQPPWLDRYEDFLQVPVADCL